MNPMTEAQEWGATDAEFTAAEDAVDDALASATHLLSAAEAAVLRDSLLGYLFGTPNGRFLLSQVVQRTAPNRSGDIAKEDAEPGDAKRKAGGDTK